LQRNCSFPKLFFPQHNATHRTLEPPPIGGNSNAQVVYTHKGKPKREKNLTKPMLQESPVTPILCTMNTKGMFVSVQCKGKRGNAGWLWVVANFWLAPRSSIIQYKDELKKKRKKGESKNFLTPPLQTQRK
jgi:hypothetical protein